MSIMKNRSYQTVGSTSLDTCVGLVCHYQFENGSSQFVFMDVESGSEASLNHFLCFSTENFVQTLASCNGLILLSGFREDQFCYHIFNPLTKHNVTIPQTKIQENVSRVGLAFDGCQFEVVLVEAGSSQSNGLKLHVFSSDTGKWRSHNPINLTAPPLPEYEFQEFGTPPLYSNGAIHWEIGGHLLVYQVQGSHFELYELPNYSEDWYWQPTLTFRRCLCESGGRTYYCHTDFDGLHIWKLLNEHEHAEFLYYWDYKTFPWRLVHSVNHEMFMSKLQNFCYNLFHWEPFKIAPIAYSEETQIIYLQLPGSVVSYNLDTGTLGPICTYSYPGTNFNCCSFFSSTTRNAQSDTIGETELHLPIAEMDKLAL
ncbi:unnamed protein product [Sphenostylis stenocarpa]|uniref:F-box protein At3g26010-like beta-propeller domain-containing protein n=1 Tax=Sphenostylis stenocarpa TaxID=92480 RepID=A0AA86T254_9FABA|nr:unnamed protein product [Sphenostylis stenocarpa]